MQNPFKKILNMADKQPNAPLAEEPVNGAEQPENQTEVAENDQETPQPDPRIAELEQQLEESRNKYLYLFSDFENAKRHAARERMELIQTAGRDIMTALLPILDDFDRAAKNGALNDGMALIHNKLVQTLKNRGLSVIETKAGDDFNADHHEAVAEIPAPAEELKGKIVDILEPGYLLGERIIRFAKVVIGK